MAKYKYEGPKVNMGRFGEIKHGDVLDLTSREEDHVQGDKRFKKHVEGEKPKKESKFGLPDNFEKLNPEQKAETLKAMGLPENFELLSDADRKIHLDRAEKAESDRRAMLEEQNRKTRIEEIRQMTKAALLDTARKLKAEGKEIDFKDADEPKALRRKIVDAMFGSNKEDKEDEGGEE